MTLIKVLAHSVVDYFELSNEFTVRLMERTEYARRLHRLMQVMGVPLEDAEIEKLTEISEEGTREILKDLATMMRHAIDGKPLDELKTQML